MSIIGMVDDLVRRQKWQHIKKNPTERSKIRHLARDVLYAETDVAEYAAIIALRKALP